MTIHKNRKTHHLPAAACDRLFVFGNIREAGVFRCVSAGDLQSFGRIHHLPQIIEPHLTVTAQKNLNKEEHEGKKILRQERYSGSCSRTFYIGDVKAEDVKGKYDAGILTLEFPKEDQKKIEEKRTIAID